MLETVCVPKTKEGRWISRLELVDSDAVDVKTDESLVAYGSSSLKKLAKKSTYLLVKQHDVYGHCEEECETIAKTCVDLTDEKVLGSGFGWGLGSARVVLCKLLTSSSAYNRSWIWMPLRWRSGLVK